jgi:23S rRNA G2445 N2-methylase RlmL
VIQFTVVRVELECLRGLDAFARDEVAERLPGVTVRAAGEGRLGVLGDAPIALDALNRLRSVVAAYLVEEFAVPRPRALLGQQHLDRIVAMTGSVLQTHAPHIFRTLRLSAAGADSSVLSRLVAELGDALDLSVTTGPGDLLVAVRRGGAGWEVLVRTSPRPLSARAWRVCDFPGALNATAAYAMVRLSEPVDDEVFVNVGCGSGTLIVERLAAGPAGSVSGYDTDVQALECARANLAASGFSATLSVGDATRLPLAEGSVRTVVGDLPYAMLLGSAGANASLYPAIVSEAARILEPGGRLVLVTTQTHLMQRVTSDLAASLRVEREVSFAVPHARGVISPRLWCLQRL